MCIVFFRTILCNSLVWSCSVTGKTNLTYEEAVESERKAKKRLGTLPKPLKRGLLWLADHTQRGRLSDMVDDVWRFASGRYFRDEIVEAIVNEQWCDCKVINVIPPTQQEIDKDAEEEREEQLKENSDSPSKSKKGKKSINLLIMKIRFKPTKSRSSMISKTYKCLTFRSYKHPAKLPMHNNNTSFRRPRQKDRHKF